MNTAAPVSMRKTHWKRLMFPVGHRVLTTKAEIKSSYLKRDIIIRERISVVIGRHRW